MIRQTFVGLAALASSGALAAQPATTKLEAVSGIPNIDGKTQTEDVQFKNERDDRMTVPVRLSGVGPFRFLVDTGADRTAVSREVVGRLGLVKGNKASVHTMAGVSQVSTATVPKLELTRKPVMVIDAPVLESANMGADGILGVDSFARSVCCSILTRTHCRSFRRHVPDFGTSRARSSFRPCARMDAL